MKKGRISFLLVLTMLFSLVSAHAERDISIYVDNAQLKCDVPAFIDNGRTMVPMRNIFESLGAQVSWDGETKTITAQKPDVKITLQIDSTVLTKNGASEELDTVPTIVSDTTFVPVRAVSQALGANVKWNNEAYAVYITSDSTNTGGNDEPNVLTYTEDGLTISVDLSEAEAHKEVGGDTEPVVTMYAPDGRTLSVPQSEVEAYKGVGWYTEPVVMMYAADGRTLYVVQSEVEAYKGVGWYTEPVVTMYAPDGRTLPVIRSEVEAYKGVGWYTEPVVMMYAADGRTTYAPKSEVEAYKRVGWYTEPYTPPKSSSGSGGSGSASYGGSTHVGSTVYITPTGVRYHYSASCAGKNARATTLSSAQASGYTPCKKCAR
ncbi:MAG: hypothetical protein J1F01_01060 [Oscillospiraceae bacterium]|nr:hypothetical protein [Oscillospiraceae bacterium]